LICARRWRPAARLRHSSTEFALTAARRRHQRRADLGPAHLGPILANNRNGSENDLGENAGIAHARAVAAAEAGGTRGMPPGAT